MEKKSEAVEHVRVRDMKNSNAIQNIFKFVALAFVLLASPIPRAEAEQFSIVVLPDTQSYLNANEPIFAAQTQWIADNAVAENIIYVTHLGDIVDTGTCQPTDAHWAVANDAFTILDTAGIPYGIHPGNHDYDFNPGSLPCTATQPTAKYNDGTLGRPGFGADRYLSPPYGAFDEQFDPSPVSATKENDNNFVLFQSPGGVKFISINLAWSNVNIPAVLDWADAKLKDYPNRKAIITSHEISVDRSTSTPCAAPVGNNFGTYGGEMWNALKDNPNLYMMLSGHCQGEHYFRMSGSGVQTAVHRVDTDRACMSDVHVMLSNYQFMNYNGPPTPAGNTENTGYLRIMRFDTIANTVDVETFSPWIDTYPGGDRPAIGTDTIGTMSTTSASSFTIDYDTAISPSGVVLLPDTSGSMGWGIDGTFVVPEAEKRITFAKQASDVFVDLMFTAPSSPAVVNLGLATFPDHPFPFFVGSADRIIDMTLFDSTLQASMHTAIGTQLTPGGGTPMLFGLEDADNMMSGMDCRAIVLLSDGAHNTPFPASVGSAAVTTTLGNLGVGGSDITQVYAINFAGPGEGDIPLLQDIATQTGGISQFFDATTDISGSSFSTGLGLTSIYKSILADVLNLELGVDPIDTIGLGETKSFFQSVSEMDTKVTFIVSWGANDNPLSVAVYDSSGQVVFPGDEGVEVINRNTYLIFSIGKKVLDVVGRVGPNPWRVDVNSPFRDGCDFTRLCDFDDVIGATTGDGEQLYQYSAILDSGLKFRARLGKSNHVVGDAIRMTAELIEGRRPILGLKQIEVIVGAPGDGQGNWYAANFVSPKQLSTIPTQQGDELLSPIFRKALYLTQVAGVAYPARKPQRSFTLFDDGTNGDVVANDGVYTNTFSDTLKEGVYSFRFKASGPTRHGNFFNRERSIHEYLGVRTVAEAVDVAAVLLSLNDIKGYDFSLTPKDLIGNFVGPGFVGNIDLRTNVGQFEGALRDNLDGSYTQTLLLDLDEDENNVDIVFNVAGAQKAVNLGEVLRGDEPDFLMCDTNDDGVVDIIDIRAILAKRNQPATGPDDPMDWDQDGVITVVDARGCQLSCTLPRCATP